MDALDALYGRELALDTISGAIHDVVRRIAPDRVGAVHVTCADEAEIECARAFERGFVEFTVPSLKSGLKAPFTLANLGGRYEWGAVAVAENHFTDGVSPDEHPLLVVKLNAHVGREPRPSLGLPATFGWRERYGAETMCCGMLASLLAGGTQPAADELRELFASEGKDRLGAILDDAIVSPALRPLVVALVSARLQARAVMADLQDHARHTHTTYLVLLCVTVNRPGPDSEILCGSYVLGPGSDRDGAVYRGLGDDPSRYEITFEDTRVRVRDDQIGRARTSRDHRRIARRFLSGPNGDPLRRALAGPEFAGLRRSGARGRGADPASCRKALVSAFGLLERRASVPAAIAAFAWGLLGIHHVFGVHCLMEGRSGSDAARRVLRDVCDQLALLPDEVVRSGHLFLLAEGPAEARG